MERAEPGADPLPAFRVEDGVGQGISPLRLFGEGYLWRERDAGAGGRKLRDAGGPSRIVGPGEIDDPAAVDASFVLKRELFGVEFAGVIGVEPAEFFGFDRLEEEDAGPGERGSGGGLVTEDGFEAGRAGVSGDRAAGGTRPEGGVGADDSEGAEVEFERSWEVDVFTLGGEAVARFHVEPPTGEWTRRSGGSDVFEGDVESLNDSG